MEESAWWNVTMTKTIMFGQFNILKNRETHRGKEHIIQILTLFFQIFIYND